MSEKVTANFNNRKHIRWSNRLSSKNKAENKNKNQLEHKQIIPIRIAKIVTKNIQVEFMKQPDIKEITLIVEFSNDTLEIVNPTKIECNSEVLGKTKIIIHYKDLLIESSANIIRPKFVE